MADFLRFRVRGPLDQAFAHIPATVLTTTASEAIEKEDPETEPVADDQDVIHRPAHPLVEWVCYRLLPSIERNILVVAGRPGTGKSTLIHDITAAVHGVRLVDSATGVARRWYTMVLAPTNRACEQLRDMKVPMVMTMAFFLSRQKETVDGRGRAHDSRPEIIGERAATALRTQDRWKMIYKLIRKRILLLIVDEAWMVSDMETTSLDIALRQLGNPDMPFGGLPIIFSGDYRQMEPVGSTDQPVQPFCAAKVFQGDTYYSYELTTLHRCKDERLEYVLEHMYKGTLPLDAIRMLEQRRVGPRTTLQPPIDTIYIKSWHKYRERDTITHLKRLEATANYTMWRFHAQTIHAPEMTVSADMDKILGQSVLVVASPRGCVPEQRLRVTNNILRSDGLITNTMLLLEQVVVMDGEPRIWVRKVQSGERVLVAPVATVIRTHNHQIIERRKQALKDKKSLPAYIKNTPEFKDPSVVAIRKMFPFEAGQVLTPQCVQGITLKKNTGICFELTNLGNNGAAMLMSRAERLDDVFVDGEFKVNDHNQVVGIRCSPWMRMSADFIKRGCAITA
jgi:hypothetical protein